uniref:Lipoprotein n=1 Tax=Strongyloides venezuelensis TaxID=75913 RepID=A0A0K0FRL4_STRVS
MFSKYLGFKIQSKIEGQQSSEFKKNNDSQREKFMKLQYVIEVWKDRSSYPVNSMFNEGQEDYYRGDKLQPRTEKGKILYKDNGVTKIQPDEINDN